jgi:hypothetical protein
MVSLTLTAGDLYLRGALRVLEEHERMVFIGNDRTPSIKWCPIRQPQTWRQCKQCS